MERIGLHWPEAGAVEGSWDICTWTWCVCCVVNWLWKKPVLCMSTHCVSISYWPKGGATADGSIVVVISPLTAIMKDQVTPVLGMKQSSTYLTVGMYWWRLLIISTTSSHLFLFCGKLPTGTSTNSETHHIRFSWHLFLELMLDVPINKRDLEEVDVNKNMWHMSGKVVVHCCIIIWRW